MIYLIVTCHGLHTTSNWFILSLSFADLFVGLFLTPVSTSCVLLSTSYNVLVMNLFFDLFAFRFHWQHVRNDCCPLLLCGAADDLFPEHDQLARFAVDSRGLGDSNHLFACTLHVDFLEIVEEKRKAEMIFGTIQIISFNISPCIIMVFVYVHIFIISQKHSRQIRALTVNQRRADPDTLNPRQIRQERSATKAFGLLLLFFLLCWLLSAYRHFCGYLNLSSPIFIGTVITSRFLMVINSAVNPFIYAFLKTDIRREVKRRISRRKTTAKSFSHRLSTIN